MIRLVAAVVLLSGACRTGTRPASGDTGDPSRPSIATTTPVVDTAAHLACDDQVVPGVVVRGYCVQPEPVEAICGSLNLLPPSLRPAVGCPTFLDVVQGSGFLDGDFTYAWDGNPLVLFRCALLSDGSPFDQVYRRRKRHNDGHAYLSTFDVTTGDLVSVEALPDDSWDEVNDRYRRVFCCSGTLAHSVVWGEQLGLCRADRQHSPDDFSGSAP